MGNPYYRPVGGGGSSSPYANEQGYGLGAQAVALAARYLGVPYVWGGMSPKGFDCSGLVKFTYDKLGIKLPRTSFEQYKTGIPVNRSNLQPGDLLFFNSGPGSSSTTPGHVSIYAGGGQEVVASHTGTPVMRRAVNWTNFIGARRETGGGSSSSAAPAAFNPGATGAPQASTATVPVGWHIPGTPWDLPTPGDAIGGVEGAAAGIGRALTRVGILAPIVLGGVALIVLGGVRAVSNGQDGSPGG